MILRSVKGLDSTVAKRGQCLFDLCSLLVQSKDCHNGVIVIYLQEVIHVNRHLKGNIPMI